MVKLTKFPKKYQVDHAVKVLKQQNIICDIALIIFLLYQQPEFKLCAVIITVVFTAGLDIRPKLSQPCKLQFYYAFSLFETDSLIRFVLEYLYGLTDLTACDLHRI